jgi:hypothetical protein
MCKTETCVEGQGFGREVPPTFYFVGIYFNQRECSSEQAEVFFRFYSVNRWKTHDGRKIANWKNVANNWIWNYQQLRRSLST